MARCYICDARGARDDEMPTSQLAVLGSLGAAFLSPLAFGAFLWARSRREA